MKENLNCDVISDGQSACYDNDPDNCAKYGRLYDWLTAMALPGSCSYLSCSDLIKPKHQGICPSGWHIPSDEDWDKLIRFVGGIRYADHYDYSCPAEFSAPLGGVYYTNLVNGYFVDVGYGGYWWSTSEAGLNAAYYWKIQDLGDEYYIKRDYFKMFSLLSVRCLQD